ncbi:plasmid mobilization protein [Rhodopirellula bahusiensis]|uniref:Uncharacterized protein n=1 Tax=Rhodopirellula bahusiensis TaxID=2014065 RepID=A0A2G1VXH8_9BACT|nr:plasmid mobilization relaxosome protein MobC [Rhodopirellula bahusiensis]PHQ31494.1 hypothetical protein CEE69_30810 [Rhodopirellula bahusiensis]
MARPKKHALERRTEEVNTRFTLLELDHIQNEAKKAGLSRAAFIRKRSLSERIVAPQVRGVDPAAIMKLDKLIQEINAIGVNVNQIALAANTDRRVPLGSEHVADALDAMRQKVETTLDELVSGDGS